MFFYSTDSPEKKLLRWFKNLKIEFPSNNEELEKLQVLDIKLKDIKNIPKEISCLSNLREIHAEFNELSELPWEFAHLKNLKSINFSHNKFTDVPGVICQLVQLEELNMESNSIKKISPVIANLSNLKDLNLSFNHINELPSEIGHLKHLEKLNVAANNLTELPSSMHKLYNLTELKLWKNFIKEIPEFIKELPNLKNIVLEIETEKIDQQLITSVINDDIEKVEKLLSIGANVNYKWQNYGAYPFTNCLFEAHSIEMIKLLLGKGADPNVKREVLKSSSIKIWESDKSSNEYETFLTKKHPLEISKYIKSLNL